ncbi:hypothetical protein Ddc_16625 [Ditylenchus destructor]|nr:hypothetical protein Ddc_16625 [Ditylenchus destructor]
MASGNPKNPETKTRELREKLGKSRDDNDILTKKKLGEDSCKISELRQSNKKLGEKNEVLKTNLTGPKHVNFEKSWASQETTTIF